VNSISFSTDFFDAIRCSYESGHFMLNESIFLGTYDVCVCRVSRDGRMCCVCVCVCVCLVCVCVCVCERERGRE